MRVLVVSFAFLAAACAAHEPTYRELDQIGAEYRRDTMGGPRTAEEATAQDACGARRFQHLIGTPAGEIERSTLPPRARILTPDMMVTQDFSAERLNIMVGTDGLVGSMRCF